jgi:hypothetical protein
MVIDFVFKKIATKALKHQGTQSAHKQCFCLVKFCGFVILWQKISFEQAA